MRTKGDFPDTSDRTPAGKREDGTSFCVLVVDDSIFVTKQIEQILTSEGFEVVGKASNGEEGLEKYKELSPKVDLVTLDITMPKMDGITCLERIIEYDNDARVIMVSALGKQDLVKKALLLGAKNYIVKPLDRKKVLDRVVMVLK
jgi:two-component system chemotaxis response regulator CheY